MLESLIAFALTLPGMVVLDTFARPPGSKAGRRMHGLWLLTCVTATAFGALLGMSGNPALAAILTLSVHLLLIVASHAKNRVLGEPLVFADLALIRTMFRHPQFYFSVLTDWQKFAGLAALVFIVVVLAWLTRPDLTMGAIGLAMAIGGLAAMMLSFRLGLFRKFALRPDLSADIAALGLVPVLLLYWNRWRREEAAAGSEELNRAEPSNGADAEQLIVVVQCESFADPVELFGTSDCCLPSLEAARADAVQWGNLLVSGFGAYTMRTEYGVLFGRDEATLGFRRFDPYLTAIDDVRHAIPNKLETSRWESLFVHPHDMRFYNRDRILPAAGFAELAGEEEFAYAPRGDGRYVTDAAVADKILERAASVRGPAFIYAVTIENHGPWAEHGDAGTENLITNYNRLVQKGDLMLAQLREGIAALARPSMLVFFGDHRPSIPGASMPGSERHTPYVIVKFDADGRVVSGANRKVDLTPAQLHHAILGLKDRNPN